MKPEDGKDLVKMFFQAKLKIPLCFIGPKGVGKTMLVEQAVRELNEFPEYKDQITFLDVRLSLDTPEDIAGWPRPTEDSVKYLMSDWGHATFRTKYCVIFFDEINRSPLETRQALFELISKGSIRRKPINENYMLVFAMNPDNGNYQVEQLDSAFERRLIRVGVTADHKQWLEWAKTTKLHDDVQTFIKSNAGLLYVPEEWNLIVQPNPDAWKMVSEIISALPDMKKHIKTEIFSGLVGKEAAIAFLNFQDQRKTAMTAEELFDGWPDTKKILLKADNSSLTATLDSVGAFINDDKNHKKELFVKMNELMDELPLEFGASLLSRFGREFTQGFVKQLDKTPKWRSRYEKYRFSTNSPETTKSE